MTAHLRCSHAEEQALVKGQARQRRRCPFSQQRTNHTELIGSIPHCNTSFTHQSCADFVPAALPNLSRSFDAQAIAAIIALSIEATAARLVALGSS